MKQKFLQTKTGKNLEIKMIKRYSFKELNYLEQILAEKKKYHLLNSREAWLLQTIRTLFSKKQRLDNTLNDIFDEVKGVLLIQKMALFNAKMKQESEEGKPKIKKWN